jgi:glycosyltransferase involved in cell wall biosynthesis
MGIRITAVICTLNRAAYLSKAVQSLVDQTLPKDKYEIIVVDNGSTDNTKAVVKGFRCDNLRCVYEPVLGLSQARNTGWENAGGEYVAYMDDDAVACPEWLERIVEDFENIKPRPGSVGGRITLIWEAQRPGWLPNELELPLGHIEWGDAARFLTSEEEFLGGGNVAYPREVLETCGGFSTMLGRKGNNLLSNDELLVKKYLQKNSLGSYYDPQVWVQHHAPPGRLSKHWFYRRYFWQGISAEIMHYIEDDFAAGRVTYLSQAFLSTLRFLRSPQYMWFAIVPANTQRQMLTKCTAHMLLGQIYTKMRIGLGIE